MGDFRTPAWHTTHFFLHFRFSEEFVKIWKAEPKRVVFEELGHSILDFPVRCCRSKDRLLPCYRVTQRLPHNTPWGLPWEPGDHRTYTPSTRTAALRTIIRVSTYRQAGRQAEAVLARRNYNTYLPVELLRSSTGSSFFYYCYVVK